MSDSFPSQKHLHGQRLQRRMSSGDKPYGDKNHHPVIALLRITVRECVGGLIGYIVTHCDFTSLVGLQDPDAALTQVSVFHRQVRPGFTHFSVAHVESDDITTVPDHEATHTGGSVDQAATLPLTNVDLKGPQCAFVQNKGPDVAAVIVSV